MVQNRCRCWCCCCCCCLFYARPVCVCLGEWLLIFPSILMTAKKWRHIYRTRVICSLILFNSALRLICTKWNWDRVFWNLFRFYDNANTNDIGCTLYMSTVCWRDFPWKRTDNQWLILQNSQTYCKSNRLHGIIIHSMKLKYWHSNMKLFFILILMLRSVIPMARRAILLKCGTLLFKIWFQMNLSWIVWSKIPRNLNPYWIFFHPWCMWAERTSWLISISILNWTWEPARKPKLAALTWTKRKCYLKYI